MTDWPIDWREVLDEAKSRRIDEGLSQRALADLAGVSAPTVSAFEQGEIGINFASVAAILEALGLFVRPGPADSLQAFVHRARRRWTELIANLPEDSPSRQPAGHSEQAYAVDPITPARTLGALRSLLAGAPHSSGWPPFIVLTRDGLRPTIEDRVVECWLGDPEVDRPFTDAASSDFWQVGRDGTAYLQRGYQEDGRDFDPGTIFDLTLPIWRTIEVLRHAAWLAEALGGDGDTRLRFRARYAGLAGRTLTAWAKRGAGLLRDNYRSRTDVVDLAQTTSVDRVHNDLADVVLAILAPLYDRFGGYELQRRLIVDQIEEMPDA